MSKYNERVTARAQEFAMEYLKISVSQMQVGMVNAIPFDKMKVNDADIKPMREQMMLAARLSVAREAEAFKGGYNKAWSDANNEYYQPISDILIDHGLIPPPNETI